jgi:hypothetical protein
MLKYCSRNRRVGKLALGPGDLFIAAYRLTAHQVQKLVVWGWTMLQYLAQNRASRETGFQARQSPNLTCVCVCMRGGSVTSWRRDVESAELNLEVMMFGRRSKMPILSEDASCQDLYYTAVFHGLGSRFHLPYHRQMTGLCFAASAAGLKEYATPHCSPWVYVLHTAMIASIKNGKKPEKSH